MSDYHLTKLEAENVVNQAKMNSINLRLSSPCGPFIGTTGFIGFVIKHLDLGRDIPLFGKGTRRQDYFDIRVLLLCAFKFMITIQKTPSTSQETKHTVT